MRYRAESRYEEDDGFYFTNRKQLRKKTNSPADFRIFYAGDDPVRRDLFGAVSRLGDAEKIVGFIEGTDDEGRLAALCRLQKRGWHAHRVLNVPESVNGRIVVDSREVSPDYPGRIESEENAVNYYLWELTNFEDYRGYMTKKDFWRFFDYKRFLDHREIVSFEYGGVFYVLMLWPYYYE